jgi:hypothetical protein
MNTDDVGSVGPLSAALLSTHISSSSTRIYKQICPAERILRSAGQSNARNYIRCTQVTNIHSTGVHPDDTTISDFQVTHKDKGYSLKMAHKCRNM